MFMRCAWLAFGSNAKNNYIAFGNHRHFYVESEAEPLIADAHIVAA